MTKHIRQIFVHLHIPKCGGSSVVDFLERNFARHLYSTNSILNDYQHDADQIQRIINQHPNLKCLTGHKHSLDLPFENNNLDLRAFTWIRDPVDRFISHYFYHRNHTELIPEVKKMDLVRYTEWALKYGNQQMYISGQVKFLAKGSMQKIKSLVAENKLFLFPLAKLQRSFLTLEHNFPDTFINTRGKNKNISQKDQKIPENYREIVLPYVQDDIKLLELSNQTILTNEKSIQSKIVKNHYGRKTWRLTIMSCVRFLHRLANYLELKQ